MSELSYAEVERLRTERDTAVRNLKSYEDAFSDNVKNAIKFERARSERLEKERDDALVQNSRFRKALRRIREKRAAITLPTGSSFSGLTILSDLHVDGWAECACHECVAADALDEEVRDV